MDYGVGAFFVVMGPYLTTIGLSSDSATALGGWILTVFGTLLFLIPRLGGTMVVAPRSRYRMSLTSRFFFLRLRLARFIAGQPMVVPHTAAENFMEEDGLAVVPPAMGLGESFL